VKQYAVIFTPRAERQLAHLYGYIADQSGEARAENYVGKIVAACHALSTSPSPVCTDPSTKTSLRHSAIQNTTFQSRFMLTTVMP